MNVLGVGSFQAAKFDPASLPAAWRKATRNMVFAARSLERALSALNLSEDERSSMALVLGTVSGDLETSADFLTTLSRTKMARPVLFQNSLHNATTGFVSIHFKLRGPSFSVSPGAGTPGECLSLAQDLLREGHARVCAVVLVEAHKVLAELIGETVGEGAAALILSTPEFTSEKGLEPLAASVPSDWFEPYPENAAYAPLVDIQTSRLFAGVRALES
jgi:hypothetical protein